MPSTFRRDRLTWVLYAVAAWFAFLQAAPGLVVPHLRDELDLGYTAGGLHVAAFAAGSVAAGLVSAPLERVLGRRRLLWSAAVVLAAGTVGLTSGQVVAATVGSVLVMGVGGGLLLATIQATLADHHGELRAVALAEENLAAGLAYLGVAGALSLTAAAGAGWRPALLVSLVVPVLVWATHRRLDLPAVSASTEHDTGGRLPGAFWAAAGVLVCTTAAEWCTTAWGAAYVEEAVDVSADRAVGLMGGFFVGVVAGRLLGSRLARRFDPAALLAAALVVAGVGFAVTWPAQAQAPAVVGLLLLGVGLGNLFPLGMSIAVSLAPGRSGVASGRVVAVSSFAVLLAPLTVGAVADATSLSAALLVVPALLVLAGLGLAAIARADRRRDQRAARGEAQELSAVAPGGR